MKRCILLISLLGTLGWSQTRVISHITRINGGFDTTLNFRNVSSDGVSLKLTGYSENGQQLGATDLSFKAGELISRQPSELWATADSPGWLTIEGSNQVQVTAVYRSTSMQSSPAHIPEQSVQARVWELFPGNWEVVFDGVALVNHGPEPARIQVLHLDEDGNTLDQRLLTESLLPNAKKLAVLGGPTSTTMNNQPPPLLRIESNQPLSITGLRGDLPGSRYLWANTAWPRQVNRTVQSFTVTTVPQEVPAAFHVFDQYIEVFGVRLFATALVDESKILHAAKVMAEYLDNDEDGRPDDPTVIQSMQERNASMIMFGSENDPARGRFEAQANAIVATWALQDLQGNETHPNGSSSAGFDATLEEVLHLISDNGYAIAYPNVFGSRTGTQIAQAMDQARGGFFQNVPTSYPEGAWYTYDDTTCSYACQITEYFYWALTSLLGAQEYPGRLDEISQEWRLNTRRLLEQGDPQVFALLTNPQYRLPKKLPDGRYAVQATKDLLSEIAEALPGYQMTFASPSTSGGSDIWLAGVDGNNPRNLTENLGGNSLYPEWGPTASWIYFTSNAHGGDAIELYTVNTVGDPMPIKLSGFGKEVRSLYVSPNNQNLVLGLMSSAAPFGSDLGPYSSDLYVLPMAKLRAAAAGGSVATMADLISIIAQPIDHHLWHEQPAWSPNSSDPWIAFSRTFAYDTPQESEAIWLVRPDGSEARLLLEDDSMPRWNHDGSEIVTFGGVTIELSSGNQSRFKVDGLQPDAGAFSVSPDGQFLVFETSDEQRKAGLARVIFSGQDDPNPIVQLLDQDAYEPRWSPRPVPTQR